MPFQIDALKLLDLVDVITTFSKFSTVSARGGIQDLDFRLVNMAEYQKFKDADEVSMYSFLKVALLSIRASHTSP